MKSYLSDFAYVKNHDMYQGLAVNVCYQTGDSGLNQGYLLKYYQTIDLIIPGLVRYVVDDDSKQSVVIFRHLKHEYLIDIEYASYEQAYLYGLFMEKPKAPSSPRLNRNYSADCNV